jgi:hypothetical protein
VKIAQPQAVVLLACFVLTAVLMFAAGTRCNRDPGPPIPIPTDIDAGPGEAEIAARLDGAVQVQAAALAEAERRYQDDIAAFDASQREKYEQLQQQDLDTVVEFLARWHQERAHASP